MNSSAIMKVVPVVRILTRLCIYTIKCYASQCLYLAQSFVLFVCLALENAFCRLRGKRLMSVVIHGFDGLFQFLFLSYSINMFSSI